MAWIEKRGSKHVVRWRETDGTVQSQLGRTKDEARAVRARVESQLLEGLYTPSKSRERPFGDYVVDLLNAELGLEASTRYQHKKLFERWVDPFIGDIAIGELHAAAIRRYFAAMQAEGAHRLHHRASPRLPRQVLPACRERGDPRPQPP